MPLISAATAAYAAGLLLGFAHATAVAVTLALAVAAASIASRRPADAATALLVLAGAMVAQATARDDARCLASLGRRQAWRVLLDGAARPGAFVRARADACHADLWLSVERGRAQAGDAAQVSGRAVRTQRGLMVQHASVRVVDGGSTLRRWREAAGRRIDGAFGADAALARALLVADTRGIPAAARDRYAAAGLSHMLSISGLHVALIALALQLAFEIARLPRRRADIATVVVIGGYVALLGAPAPALRSAVMLGLLIATRLAQRPTSPWAILALGALVPLGDPRIVLDVGWQLSTAGVAALIAASAFARRVRWLSRQRGVVRTVLHGAVASTVATIVSAPLVAWSFGRLSLIGPASNLVAGPIMTIAQPMLFLSLVASPVPALARFIADAAHPLLVAFDAVASAAAAVPGASIAVAPTATTAALAGVAVIAMIVACVARFPARPAATALA
ncbi:MAG TPA: ComEC/Rec2 family competence protein, partial [Gemmatimonadaceae bacterium]|nr:ComEC/Rec2 family competence protein [Gemmatimonadaceae bacterium]